MRISFLLMIELFVTSVALICHHSFYLMEGDSIPIKSYWLDVVLSEIEVNRPFAIMGAKYSELGSSYFLFGCL